ncbi:MAG TPA: lipoyl(octanoyl) transferase LipB [Candidatus Omnitrophota bacterium]|nr:lipoyl(octanoyl) transferase LipB [Candidatus Omnitrophota bacterium]
MDYADQNVERGLSGGRLAVLDLGVTRYGDAFRIQLDNLEKRITRGIPDTLIVTEHEPIVTLGRLSSDSNILNTKYFGDNSISIERTNRGGDVTYHAPGQLVFYPIVDLSAWGRDIATYIDFLEISVMKALIEIGVCAERIRDVRGVWARDRKIAFTGVAVKKWITYHGVSVNVNNDVEPFRHMNPCGIKNIKVTSVMNELGASQDLNRIKDIFCRHFISNFENQIR